ncbi:hypothetical protein BH09PSE2_BH09PSE2_09710 [soil metagenome]
MLRRLTLSLSRVAVSLAMSFASAGIAQAAQGASIGGGRYVSMGSSYAAGPGVGVRDAASGACARSLSNYARRLAARRGLQLVDVACSGATTEDVLTRPQAGFRPQIEAVTPETRLVTITIGGNDVGYVADLMGYSCRGAGRACPVKSDAEVEAGFAALPGAMRRVLSETRRRAPDAKVVLVGYLPAVSKGRVGCGSLEPLSEADAARIRSEVDRLEQVFASAAKDTGALFVRMTELAIGHDACAAEPWITNYKASQVATWPVGVPYHPNQAGMDHLADAIDAVLSSPNGAISPVFTPAAKGAPFSAAVQVGDILYLSGQIGAEANGVLPEGMPAQAKQAMENIKGVLAGRGLGMDSVFKCTVMLADMRRWAEFNTVYVGYFRPDRLSARSALGANGLALGAQVEVECWAHRPQG